LLTSPLREVAPTIIVDPSGRLLLQLRDNIPGVSYAGKIGLFGGHREGNETFLECAVRELHEELSYFLPPERFERFEVGEIEVANGTVRAEYFLVRDVPTDALRITEGSLIVANIDDIARIDHNLTPTARFALKEFLKRQNAAR
jgi:8-oxo-dGTP pyrophosphatase MutT (NUDIX family)